MSLVKTWYEVDKAAAKYGLTREEILELVRGGLVRSEEGENGEVVRVKADDVKLQLMNYSRPEKESR
ncbi:hypothetical protein [Geoalkalibacter subterraneus]|jgi:hypothetical protein|uniref:Uncharacterized protein n=1 Tax=Geoalkalibacter subterraneus TaxID=483547 RepID=A0A0B5FPF2_9BACT|nr:hypothetical protein [Geoalkalibacter subterraneus]AJF05491.1 hypothetical protein GSUB_01360 [Geoalkalibacter subterraneus]